MFEKKEKVYEDGNLYRHGVEKITPEIAKDLLKNHNVGNRGIDKSRIKSYARDIRKDFWGYMPDGRIITVDETGNLLNGQTRLEAIVRCGIPLEMEVYIYDMKTSAKNVIVDIGRARDSSFVNGIPNEINSTLNVFIRTIHTGHIAVSEQVELYNGLLKRHKEFLNYLAEPTKVRGQAFFKAAFLYRYIVTGNDFLKFIWDYCTEKINIDNVPQSLSINDLKKIVKIKSVFDELKSKAKEGLGSSNRNEKCYLMYIALEQFQYKNENKRERRVREIKNEIESYVLKIVKDED